MMGLLKNFSAINILLLLLLYRLLFSADTYSAKRNNEVNSNGQWNMFK